MAENFIKVALKALTKGNFILIIDDKRIEVHKGRLVSNDQLKRLTAAIANS